jgi:hypothetical protein
MIQGGDPMGTGMEDPNKFADCWFLIELQCTIYVGHTTRTNQRISVLHYVVPTVWPTTNIPFWQSHRGKEVVGAVSAFGRDKPTTDISIKSIEIVEK